MNSNSNAIMTLCSHLCLGEDTLPLEPKEWTEFAKILRDKKVEPKDLLEFSYNDILEKLQLNKEFIERIVKLINRNASLTFEISKYENMGIHFITRADELYPGKLKKVLGNNCPPLFYYAGDIKLAELDCVGYVGARTINDIDTNFAQNTIKKTIERGFSIVSGGAKGIDSIAEGQGLSYGGKVIEYLSDSLLRRLKSSSTVRAIQEGKLLLLSHVKPDAGFNTGIAMMRNKYIYAQSRGTVVIKADYNKGGTWAGAIDNLRHNWCNEFCWENNDYKGNIELIKRGAIPINEEWHGNILSNEYSISNNGLRQISLFD